MPLAAVTRFAVCPVRCVGGRCVLDWGGCGNSVVHQHSSSQSTRRPELISSSDCASQLRLTLGLTCPRPPPPPLRLRCAAPHRSTPCRCPPSTRRSTPSPPWPPTSCAWCWRSSGSLSPSGQPSTPQPRSGTAVGLLLLACRHGVGCCVGAGPLLVELSPRASSQLAAACVRGVWVKEHEDGLCRHLKVDADVNALPFGCSRSRCVQRSASL